MIRRLLCHFAQEVSSNSTVTSLPHGKSVMTRPGADRTQTFQWSTYHFETVAPFLSSSSCSTCLCFFFLGTGSAAGRPTGGTDWGLVWQFSAALDDSILFPLASEMRLQVSPRHQSSSWWGSRWDCTLSLWTSRPSASCSRFLFFFLFFCLCSVLGFGSSGGEALGASCSTSECRRFSFFFFFFSVGLARSWGSPVVEADGIWLWIGLGVRGSWGWMPLVCVERAWAGGSRVEEGCLRGLEYLGRRVEGGDCRLNEWVENLSKG